MDVDADISRRSDWEFEPGTIYESKDAEKIVDIDEGEIRYLINKYNLKFNSMTMFLRSLKNYLCFYSGR
ncbi:MAG: hypothetical protein WBE34_02350 [Candidatus Nitrosopolaris sp.]